MFGRQLKFHNKDIIIPNDASPEDAINIVSQEIGTLDDQQLMEKRGTMIATLSPIVQDPTNSFYLQVQFDTLIARLQKAETRESLIKIIAVTILAVPRLIEVSNNLFRYFVNQDTSVTKPEAYIEATPYSSIRYILWIIENFTDESESRDTAISILQHHLLLVVGQLDFKRGSLIISAILDSEEYLFLIKLLSSDNSINILFWNCVNDYLEEIKGSEDTLLNVLSQLEQESSPESIYIATGMYVMYYYDPDNNDMWNVLSNKIVELARFETQVGAERIAIWITNIFDHLSNPNDDHWLDLTTRLRSHAPDVIAEIETIMSGKDVEDSDDRFEPASVGDYDPEALLNDKIVEIMQQRDNPHIINDLVTALLRVANDDASMVARVVLSIEEIDSLIAPNVYAIIEASWDDPIEIAKHIVGRAILEIMESPLPKFEMSTKIFKIVTGYNNPVETLRVIDALGKLDIELFKFVSGQDS